jgi:hypothetical protein
LGNYFARFFGKKKQAPQLLLGVSNLASKAVSNTGHQR